jgi:membrane associated rhomboid family serine protease
MIFVFVRITLVPAALLIGVWFIIQLFHVGSIASVQTGGVAYVAHIAGAIYGAVTARFFQDPRRVGA